MPRTIRFHLDEHCDPAIAAGLRRQGIDVTTTPEAGLLHATDEEHLAYARNQQRVVFTQDADFLKLHAAHPAHSGIAYCHQRTRSIGDIVNTLVLIWELMEPDEMTSHVEYI